MHSKIRIENRGWRIEESSGFLRARAVVIQDSVMLYNRDELDDIDIPTDIIGDPLHLYAPKEEFSTPKAIATLTGALLTVGHKWQTINDASSVGHIAGEPFLEGDDLIAEVIITDQDAIKRVQLSENDPEKLVELSASYISDILWGRGRTLHDKDFSGKQTNFIFNHLAMLPAGAGRGGSAVRISNKSEEDSDMEFTNVRLSNGVTVRVANEDVIKIENAEDEMKKKVENAEHENDEKDEKLENAADPAEFQALMTQLEEVKAQMAELQTQRSELEGSLMAVKEQLEAALAPEAIEAAAVEMANEHEESTKVMNSINADAKLIKDLHGDALKKLVVTTYRVSNSLPVLSDDQVKDVPFMSGLYQAYVDGAAETVKTNVAGATVVQLANSANQNQEPTIKRNHAKG